ncbi:MAG: TonB-dependent receptor [Acidobacteriia bacterium]|nr:TonB-dependent receptor [Terriglobia bacterium]
MRGSVLIFGLACASLSAQVRYPGRVMNETQAPVAGARLTLESATGHTVHRVADVRGEFLFDLASPGAYKLTVEKEGYFSIYRRAIEITSGDQISEVLLEHTQEIHESVLVSAAPPAIDMDSTSGRQAISGREVINVPYPNNNDLKSAMRIVPGVTRDTKNQIHIHGGGEEQVMYTLNGFNVSDPLTNRFDTRLSVESVQELTIASGNLAAEFGKGSAGTMALRTRSGDDKLRYGATNFVPGIENRKGLTIGDWTPRLNFSGPIRRGRAWFSDSVDVVYTKTVITDLPKGEDRISSWRLSNLLTGQVNLSPSNILYTGFLATVWTAPRTGLSVLDPYETTVDRRSRQWFAYVKDQIYFGRSTVLEVGYAANRTFGREIPQGQELAQFTPDGKRGNHFIDAVRNSGRDQIIANGFLPTFVWNGGHQLKAGMDLDRVGYSQDVSRTGYEYFNQDGIRMRQTLFGGSGQLARSNYEAAAFLQDSWRLRPGLLMEIGVRSDWGNLVRRWDFSPRLGLAWSPPWWENTKIFGGFARIFDASSLRLFTRPMDQHAVTTYYHPSGAVARGPAVAVFNIDPGRLLRPQYLNFSMGVEKQWFSSVATRVEFLKRRGNRGFSFLNRLDGEGPPPDPIAAMYPGSIWDALYNLTNDRVDNYRSVSFTLRQNIRRQYEWMASYTFSEALSNTVVDINVDDPISVLDNTGRMPWDTPHRVVSWAYLPTPWKNWAVSSYLEYRTGYPYNVVRDDGKVVGGVSSQRFPYYLEMNLHLERRFQFRANRWAFRFGANNITNRRNADVVINNPGSPRFGQFFGGVGRSINFRIRWLGKV